MRYLDILEGTFMTWRLRPWHVNSGKREVKAPKVYLANSGMLHSLLGMGSMEQLLAHPKCGASWEGFAITETLRQVSVRHDEAYFWGLHSGAELDLLIVRDGRRLGFEIKLTRSPKVAPAIRAAKEAVELDHFYVVCHAEGGTWTLAEGISAVALPDLELALAGAGARMEDGSEQ
jgi:predicted AAA+ superfamily ATPase